MKIVTQLEHDQLTPSGLMVHDTTPPTRIGKTTAATCVGSIFAHVRHDDRVVAIDADTAFGNWVPGSTLPLGPLADTLRSSESVFIKCGPGVGG